ncbi:Uncharacterised protein [Mycobacteroides abscessus subsp. abscessus]|nr:Uncharacterised protein [Mycobacteroides abscessus subsp. abscessus]
MGCPVGMFCRPVAAVAPGAVPPAASGTAVCCMGDDGRAPNT